MNAPRDPFPARILLVDIDPAMSALLVEWLSADGMTADTDATRAKPPAALILVELPFPRQAGRDRVAQLSRSWPGVPIVVLSPTLLPGVTPQGEVARALGADAVLPSPLSRDLLYDTIGPLVNV